MKNVPFQSLMQGGITVYCRLLYFVPLDRYLAHKTFNIPSLTPYLLLINKNPTRACKKLNLIKTSMFVYFPTIE